MHHSLPELPFSLGELQPVISEETLRYHHGKHHRGYIEKLNQLIPGTEFEHLGLEQIVMGASGPIFNNAAQAWNHTFYWNSLIPGSRYRKPRGELQEAIQKEFGSFDEFGRKLRKAAAGVFGSGWTWLVRNGDLGKVSILTTPNADNPLRAGMQPLLCVDVWEHAYYIDYRNDRAKYLEGLSQILNWEFAERNFAMPQELAA
ncbi:MAG: superoxide dismutase [Bdellovibrionota bacterium]